MLLSVGTCARRKAEVLRSSMISGLFIRLDIAGGRSRNGKSNDPSIFGFDPIHQWDTMLRPLETVLTYNLVSEVKPGELTRDIAEGGSRVAIGHTVEMRSRSQANTDAAVAPERGDSFCHFGQQTGAVLRMHSFVVSPHALGVDLPFLAIPVFSWSNSTFIHTNLSIDLCCPADQLLDAKRCR